MTALCALIFLIIGPSSESRCLCTYKAFMDAHAHSASGQSMKLMCRCSKAGCTFHNMTQLHYIKVLCSLLQQRHLIKRPRWPAFLPSSAAAVRRGAPACSLHDRVNHSSSPCGQDKPKKNHSCGQASQQ